VARIARRSAANAPGDLFVDDSCIACDTCRRLAPATFGGGEDDVAFVARQPAPGERPRAMMALVACPVAAIGSSSKEGAAEAARAFPVEVAPGVLDCGYAAESSFGAASWLVLRPDGNLLVDSPRFAAPLAERIRALGGARFMFLTHRDDVAEHARWAEALGCARVLHARDASGRTRGVERLVEGDAPVPLADGVTAIPVPGHTAGSMALHVDDEVLFTGDHLWGDAGGRLGASRSVCWWSWDAQIASMEKLGALRFRQVFPGHGRPWRAVAHEDARREVLALARAMRGA
jgi:glyoxylase-like metal-dependent hydrolase (beta-lactamase superfamily II)/ferredoxin